MKTISAALIALSLSTSIARAEDAAVIAVCLQSQYSMALMAIEREAFEMADAAGQPHGEIETGLAALTVSLEKGRLALAGAAERDVYEALNLAQNAFSGNDYVARKLRRAVEVCLL